MSGRFEAVIGLEVHAQLRTRTKLFCGCPTSYGAPPNTQVCPVCLGLPGALPVPNRVAVELAARAGIALSCEVRPSSRLARKNYFYPDLPKGYQISQFEGPINGRGEVTVSWDGQSKNIRITRAHLEEDAAKSVHGVGTAPGTHVDFNRAGVPLLEIVSEPDLRSAEEAEAYLKKIREILMFAGVNDGNLEEGSFRCDANVSIRPIGQSELGTRTELKNINSFRFVRQAIEYEIARQETLVSSGQTVIQQTRSWDAARNQTVALRSKEDAHDYRYFPDPDLPPLEIEPESIAAWRAETPESADAMRARFVDQLNLTDYDATVLTSHPEVARYFESIVSRLAAQSAPETAKKVANFVQSEVLGHVALDGLDATFPSSSERVAELLALVQDGTINNKIAKQVFAEMRASQKTARQIVEEQNLAQVTDVAAIEGEVRKVLDAHPQQVQQYRSGKTAVLGFFVGQVMKATRGAANPKAVNELLRAMLQEQS